MLAQRFRKTVAAFHPRADVLDRVAHHLVGGLLDEGLQGLHHGQTGIDHGGQLARKEDQVGQGHFAAGGLALSADLLLDGDDQEVAIEQGRDGGLLALSFQ